MIGLHKKKFIIVITKDPCPIRMFHVLAALDLVTLVVFCQRFNGKLLSVSDKKTMPDLY